MVLLPQRAWAQTIQPIQSTAISRIHEDDDRPAGDAYFYISREDCLASDVLTFDLDVQDPDAASTFQVWVGDDDDCTEETNRSGIDARCWLVYEGSINATSALIEIPVQNIAARRLPQVTNGGVSVGTLDACANDVEIGITLHFMHVSGGATSGNVVEWSTQLDLKGPAAPTDVEAGIGDKRLVVGWETVVGTRSGYLIFCEESTTLVGELSSRYGQFKSAQSTGGAGTGGASAGAGGASGGAGGVSAAAGGASAGAGGAASPAVTITPTPSTSPTTDSSAPTASGGAGTGTLVECVTTLQPGELPPADAKVCGRVDIGSADEGTAGGLENSIVYAVGVAAIDELGNPGPLSNIDCQAPEDLDEFFESYRRMGGQGGGGFCSLTTTPTTSLWLWIAAGFVLSLGCVARRLSR
jgi:hypothetical protein